MMRSTLLIALISMTMSFESAAWSHGVLNFARIGSQPGLVTNTGTGTPSVVPASVSRSSGSTIPVYTHGENNDNDEDGPRSIIPIVDTASFGVDDSISSYKSEMVDLVYERVMRRAGL